MCEKTLMNDLLTVMVNYPTKITVDNFTVSLEVMKDDKLFTCTCNRDNRDKRGTEIIIGDLLEQFYQFNRG